MTKGASTGAESPAPPASAQGDGVLAIWNDCDPDWLDAYEDWYQREHLPERLSVPGFLRGRRFEALTPGPMFLTCYDVEAPAVLQSTPYRARVEAPTPTTAEMMRSAFRNMSRTICRRATLRDGPYGGCCVTALVEDASTARSLTRRLVEPQICRIDLWSAEDDDAAPSAEERLRGGDRKIGACVFIETARAEAAQTLATSLGGQAFRLISEMFPFRQETT